MTDVQEYAARLAQAIGPRPAGTEEEQQASFVIEEILQQEATLNVRSEEFNCNPNFELPRTICCIISVVLGILTIFIPLLTIPAFIVCLITAAIYILEVLGISPLGRTSKRGVSQNIIGKYVPAQNGDQAPVTRRRKVIVVARYDTGRVRRELNGPLIGALNIIHWVEIGAMALVVIALLLRIIIAVPQDGVLVFLNVLLIIGMVGAALPIIGYLIRQTAPYNDGANCNAAGVAVMLDVARRVGLGLYDQDVEDEVVVHGEAAAREADVIPEGAEIEYAEEVSTIPAIPMISPSDTSAMAPMDLSAEIAASRAAHAEESEAVAETISVAQSETVMPAESDAVSSAQTTPAPAAAPAAAPTPALPNQKSDNVPDWYKRAQAKANRASSDSTPAQRSRFADAIDNATAVREAEAARAAEERTSAMDARLAEVHASIMNSPNAAEAHSAAQAAQAAQAAAQEEAQESLHESQQNGVEGFLASTTEAPDYETASAETAETYSTSETKQAGEVAERLLSGDVPGGQAKPAARAKKTKTEAHEMSAKAEPRRKRAITLPSLTGAIEAVNSQSIPLDEASQEADEPVLEATPATKATTASDTQSRPSFAANIPVLDATRQADQAAVEEETADVVSVAGSFNVGGATGAFTPVGDELLANVDPDDVYIDDADDSDYDEGFTSTGAMTSPSFVQMPSRKAGVLGRFRRKKRGDETSFTEAIGVDADYDARTVGRDRGGWESFRNNSSNYDNGWDEEDWNGGAFSRERLGAIASKIKPKRGENPSDGHTDDEPRRGKGHRRTHHHDEEEAPRTRFAGTEMDEEGVYEETETPRRNLHPFADVPLKDLGDDREAIREFHGGPINMEIWFVALGAELANNAGIKALIADHAAELRGSMVIDLDGLGAGSLSMIEREGMYRPARMSSRMKRYVRKAADALGLSVDKGQMLWCNTAAYVAARQGYQTLHLAGMDGKKPAYCAQADDVFDNLDEVTLQDNSDFVMELIRAI